jgi:hypothetical protein
MLSILSGILGFATSGLPSVLGFFQQKGDQKHEREMAKLQTERELELAKAGFISQEKKLKDESSIREKQGRVEFSSRGVKEKNSTQARGIFNHKYLFRMSSENRQNGS